MTYDRYDNNIYINEFFKMHADKVFIHNIKNIVEI